MSGKELSRRMAVALPISSLALVALREMGLAASPLCASCNGKGNCESKNCLGGQCYPQNNPCAGFRRRKFFFCQAGTPVCCRVRRRRHGHHLRGPRCIAISG